MGGLKRTSLLSSRPWKRCVMTVWSINWGRAEKGAGNPVRLFQQPSERERSVPGQRPTRPQTRGLEKEKLRIPWRAGGGPSLPPKAPTQLGFSFSGPTQILTIVPIIPPLPPPAQAHWEPGPTRAPEAPRLWRSGSSRQQLLSGQGSPSRPRGLPATAGAPSPPGRSLFRPPYPFFRSTSRIFP